MSRLLSHPNLARAAGWSLLSLALGWGTLETGPRLPAWLTSIAGLPVQTSTQTTVNTLAFGMPLPAVAQPRPAPAPRPAKSGPASPAVGYRKLVTAGVPMHVVQIDPRRENVRLAVVTPQHGVGSRGGWSEMINRTRPVAALTGTYFCTTTAIPVGSIIVGGQVVHRGYVGTALVHSPGQKPKMVTLKRGAAQAWGKADMVLQAGPRLLSGGKWALSPRDEGFRDPAVFQRKARTAVAITKHGKLLFVAVQKPVLLRQLTTALQKLGAVDAMCLDGGGSTGLYHAGKTHVKPARTLTNLLVVYDSKDRYVRYAEQLNPKPQWARGNGSSPG